jgi:pimeloyl-ACP methyl ester carboxylesterase
VAQGAEAQGEHELTTAGPFTVESSDDVTLVVHDLAGDVAATPLLISHATGFCAHAYAPLAEALGEQFHCLGMDHRGHGATPAPPGWDEGVGVDWRAFGHDNLAVAEAIAPDGGLVGFGHSMGGASLLMAAHRRPALFDRLVLFEPIARPRPDTPVDPNDVPLVVGARRRRRRFDSYDDAYDNFHSTRPLSLMTPESLRGYVVHGLRPAPDDGVELCCSPELEAAIFTLAQDNGVWELLPEVEVPVLVVTGVIEHDQPSVWAQPIAERLPHGEVVVRPLQTHFGPFSHPADLATLVAGDR